MAYAQKEDFHGDGVTDYVLGDDRLVAVLENDSENNLFHLVIYAAVGDLWVKKISGDESVFQPIWRDYCLEQVGNNDARLIGSMRNVEILNERTLRLRSDILRSSHTGNWQVEELLQFEEDEFEELPYIRRKIAFRHILGEPEKILAEFSHLYFSNAPVSEFTFLSWKHMSRGANLERYDPSRYDYNTSKANNQQFYNYAQGQYLAIANLDTAHLYRSNCSCENGIFKVSFRRYEESASVSAGNSIVFEFALFAGKDKENTAGRISNVLWRLNQKKEPSLHDPQTDIADLREKRFYCWERWNLSDEHDHFAGVYWPTNPHSTEPIMQSRYYGCGWIGSDHIKAYHYYLKYLETGIDELREYTENIIEYYTNQNYIGGSKLTFPYHSGEEIGWGYVGKGGHFDSMSTAQMIYGFIELYELDRSLFKGRDYPTLLLKDILKLQLGDGRFAKEYDSSLKPTIRSDYSNQTAGGFYWIPVLCKLYKHTGNQTALASAEVCAEAYFKEIMTYGFFAFGGCENDYSAFYDLDGSRGMLFAFLALYKTTGNVMYLRWAEDVQSYLNLAQLGYNTPIKPQSHYGRIGWKPKGMIFVSFHPDPDYETTYSTAVGDQQASWNAELLMELYEFTSKLIYAERAIAAMRQGSVYMDESMLEKDNNKDLLLYTIGEGNPQLDDQSHHYIEGEITNMPVTGVADYQLYQYRILRQWGGISVQAAPDKRHVLGIDCVDISDLEFSRDSLKFKVRNALSKQHSPALCVFGFGTGKVIIRQDRHSVGEYNLSKLADYYSAPRLSLSSKGVSTIEIRLL